MARIRRTVIDPDANKSPDDSDLEVEASHEEETMSDEDLDDVKADVTDLILEGDTVELSFDFGPSRVSPSVVKAYEKRGFFLEGDGRAPKGETVPDPQPGQIVIFYDFFTAGLRFPCDPMLIEILDRFNAQLYQLTPNAIVQISKFFWAVESFGDELDVDSFARFYELHP